MKYLIGIDIGTSGTKSALFDLDGNTVATATEEYPLSQPKNGWAEQDPNLWWDAVCKTLRAITGRVEDGEIVGIGLSGQMHSLVLLDQDNAILRPAILWCDGRTGAECEEIEQMLTRERLVEITGNPALPGFTASKLLWVKKNEPDCFARVRHILLAKDYIRFQLTGEYATEVSDASGMQLLDLRTRQWSEEVCDALGINKTQLARVYESPDVTGRITEDASAKTGLPVGIPVAGGAGDNAAAAVGTGVYRSGQAFTTIGTSGVVFAPTDTPIIDPKGRIHTFCAAVPETWHVMGVTQAAGLSLNWFRNTLARDASYPQIDEWAEEIPIGAERLIYLPYLMGERTPILDSNARGVFFGLSAMHDRRHMARAVMEGVSYSLYSCLELIREVGVKPLEMALCGGGSKSAFWRRMLTDLFSMPIIIKESAEGAALGAAILGGCASGVYASVEEGCRRAVRNRDRFEADAGRQTAYLPYYSFYRELYQAIKQPFADLQRL